jgi:alpha-beta hydrolase superfamily lysophospholipase
MAARAGELMAPAAEPRAASAVDEEPLVVPSVDGDLLAIVTRPPGPSTGTAAVLLRGAGWRPSSGPRRTQVRLARRLATGGVHAVRFSYHGVAESGGRAEEIVRLDQPYVDDVAAVARRVAADGLRLVLVGNCFGARTALSYAASASAGEIAGLVLVVPPVHDFEVARRLDRRPAGVLVRRITPRRAWRVVRSRTRRRAMGRTLRALSQVGTRRMSGGRGGDDPVWLSRSMCRELTAVTTRGIPVLVVYGDEDNYGRDFDAAQSGTLGGVVAAAGPLVERVTVPGRIHGLTSVATQEATLDEVERWVLTRCAGPRR